jgi:hypothetical protein
MRIIQAAKGRGEEGQAVVMVAVAMSIFLIAAIGLGVDGSHLYAQRQMAQTAADAAALSAIEDVFEGTYTATGTGFSLSGVTCSNSTTDARTPCAYASKNGFGGMASDTVGISFPGSVTGVTLAAGFPANVAKATVSRQVNTTLLRLMEFVTGPSVTTVTATATAAIVSVVSPIPIIVNHPTLTGALHGNGNISITICGGPQTSIWVNSGNGNATATSGNSNSINLTNAGPPDTGDCLGANDPGGFFGVAGGPSSPTFNVTPSGHYKPEDGWIPDPLAWVTAPTPGAGWPTNPAVTTVTGVGTDGCPSSSCQLYSPGIYPTGIDGGGQDNLFKPGIYYLQGSTGFKCDAVCTMNMATGAAIAADSTTGTSWAAGHMMVYNTGTGLFTLTANGTINLVGAPAGDANYPSILFFQDHGSVAHVGTNKNTGHMMGGGGGLTLVGTLYITNTRATMVAASSHYQRLNLQGTPGSGTKIEGEIIADVLDMGGNGGITMNLNNASYVVSQIALVN